MTYAVVSMLVIGVHTDNAIRDIAAAEQAYRDHRYEVAVKHYLAAYNVGHDAQILVIVAHIYDRTLDDPAMAIPFYRLYLASGSADHETLRAELRAAEARLSQARAPPTMIEVPAAANTRPWFWASCGFAAGVGTAAGISATYAHQKDNHQVAVSADILLGVAAAAAVTALILWLVDGSAQP